MPNKCLAPDDSSTQHDSMTTKKNIRLVTIVALLLAATLFGVCGCKTEKPFMGPKPNTPTPSPVSARAPR
jgi:hypothetical protein